MKMRKSLFQIILSCIACLLVSVNVAHAQELSHPLSGGVMVDVARRYYSLSALKSIVDTVSENKGEFIHLHLTDDQNYGIESHLLNQVASEANYNAADGSYTNPNTNKKFLSYQQLVELQQYAQAKGVHLIPEIDTPAHTGGLKALLPYADSAVSSKFKWASWEEHRQLDIENPETQQIVMQLYTELVDNLQGLQFVHIGGDEISGGLEYGHSFVKHVNQLQTYLSDKGIKTRLWNDSLSRQLLPELNHSVEITYWGYHPHKNKDLATASDLSDQGFKLLNYNGYYLAFVPKPSDQLLSDVAYAANDIHHTWELTQFHMNTGNSINSLNQVIGAAFSIWSEESGGLTDQEVVAAMNTPIIALLQEIAKFTPTKQTTTTTVSTTTETQLPTTRTTTTTEPTTVSTTRSTGMTTTTEGTTSSVSTTTSGSTTTSTRTTSPETSTTTTTELTTILPTTTSSQMSTQITTTRTSLVTTITSGSTSQVITTTMGTSNQNTDETSTTTPTVISAMPTSTVPTIDQFSNPKANLPKTGEEKNVLMIVGLLLLVSVGFTVYYRKHERSSSEK